jgi:hypothetical protein
VQAIDSVQSISHEVLLAPPGGGGRGCHAAQGLREPIKARCADRPLPSRVGLIPRRHRGGWFGFCWHEWSPATAVARRLEAHLRRLEVAVVAAVDALVAFGDAPCSC